MSPDQFTLLLTAIDRCAIALEAMGAMPPKTGLMTPIKPKYIYIGKSGESPWYFLTAEQQVPIEQTRIVGTLENLTIKVKEWEGKDVGKLRIQLKCGTQLYVLQSGIDTAFTRGFMLAIAKLKQPDLRLPIAIEVEIGTEGKKPVLCTVFSGDTRLTPTWDKDAPIEMLVEIAQQELGFAEPIQQPEPIPPIAPSELIDRINHAILKLGYHQDGYAQAKTLCIKISGQPSLKHLTHDQLIAYLGELQQSIDNYHV